MSRSGSSQTLLPVLMFFYHIPILRMVLVSLPLKEMKRQKELKPIRFLPTLDSILPECVQYRKYSSPF